jgi:ribosome recycling factor
MNRQLARKVAKEHGVSVAEVRRGVNEAIAHAQKNPNFQAENIECKGETPTADEVIAHLAKSVLARGAN